MPVLRYKQSRDIKRSFTDFVGKIFALNKQWVNEDVEVVTLTGDNSPAAFEQYPWDNEKYPLVVLFSEGSSDDHWGIDSSIANYREQMKIGVVPRSYITLGEQPIAAGIQPVQSSLILKSVDILVKNIGPYEEPITVKLWSSAAGVPDLPLASGSIKGKDTQGIEWLHTHLRPEITLVKSAEYFLSAQAEFGSYYWFTDTDVDSLDGITPFIRYATFDGVDWSILTTETPIAKIYGPSVKRLGGGLNSSIRIFIESKDLSTTQKITDLLFVYLHLAKHSNLKRREKLTLPNVTAMEYDFVSDLTDEGIYIINVNKGAEAVRVRGNDRVFSVDVTISCYSSWTEDFTLPVIEDIDISPDIESVTIILNKYT